MSEPSGAGRRAGRGGRWYGLLAAVVVATVVVTGVAGAMRATDLKAQVDGFQHLDGGGGVVSVTEPGEYAVYHELVERSGPAGDSSSPGRRAGEPTITVMASDGTPVPVQPSGISYGWGSEQADAVGTFAAQPGEYRIEASGVEGRLAFGEKIPGSPFYGFGSVLLLAAAIVVGSGVGALVVAKRRRDGHRAPEDEGLADDVLAGGAGGAWSGWTVAVVGVVALVVLGGVVFYVGQDGDGPDVVGEGAPPPAAGDAGGPSSSTTLECVAEEDFATGLCGIDPAELREINLAYADRLDFSGDLAAAGAVVDQVRAALAPVAGVQPAPSPDQVRQALAVVSTDGVVSDNAVRTAGTAFGIGVDGGCVFGSVHDGTVDVEVGGYVNDGGCLAEYGH